MHASSARPDVRFPAPMGGMSPHTNAALPYPPRGPDQAGGLPPMPPSFPEIDDLPVGEVERLVTASEEEGFEYFFESLHAVRALRAHRNQLRDHNEQLARNNLGMEKELRELVSEVTLLQNKLAEKRRVLEGLLRRQDELSQGSSTGLSARLKEAAEQAEAESEALSSDLVEGRIAAQDFVKAFLAKRHLYHLRVAKHEALLRAPSASLSSAPAYFHG